MSLNTSRTLVSKLFVITVDDFLSFTMYLDSENEFFNVCHNDKVGEISPSSFYIFINFNLYFNNI